ncbi:helix-turn-helix domain-containing protein [Alicyclobacillus macrosporangiidus]|nr:helix-turn-helix domain-containing protein [Alicyclobacillus macrosporangiidus]
MKHFETGEWVEIPEWEIERVSLERRGYEYSLPVTQGDFTQVSNYILMFWSHFIGPNALSIYLHLLMHAYGKETAWPSRKLLADECGVSEPTIHRHFAKLEEYYLAWKINVEKPNGENESNIYIVRRNVPMLSQELYEKLPPTLRTQHDLFMQKLERSGMVEVPRYEKPGPTAKKRLKAKGIRDQLHLDT